MTFDELCRKVEDAYIETGMEPGAGSQRCALAALARNDRSELDAMRYGRRVPDVTGLGGDGLGGDLPAAGFAFGFDHGVQDTTLDPVPGSEAWTRGYRLGQYIRSRRDFIRRAQQARVPDCERETVTA